MNNSKILQRQIDYRDNFIRPFSPVYKKAILNTSIKPLAKLQSSEYAGCIFDNKHYEFNDFYLAARKNEILDIIKNLQLYKTKVWRVGCITCGFTFVW